MGFRELIPVFFLLAICFYFLHKLWKPSKECSHGYAMGLLGGGGILLGLGFLKVFFPAELKSLVEIAHFIF